MRLAELDSTETLPSTGLRVQSSYGLDAAIRALLAAVTGTGT